MKYLFLGILLLSIIALASCSQTVVKYQCADGQIVENQYLCLPQKQDLNKIPIEEKNEAITDKSWFDIKNDEIEQALNRDYKKFN